MIQAGLLNELLALRTDLATQNYTEKFEKFVNK